MNRRSFVLSLFGGIAAVGLGGAAMAEAATAAPVLAPAAPEAGALDPVTRAALDQTEAEFSQVVVVRRPYVRPRPVVVRRPVYRRPVVVRRPVYVRPAYRRPHVYVR